MVFSPKDLYYCWDILIAAGRIDVTGNGLSVSSIRILVRRLRSLTSFQAACVTGLMRYASIASTHHLSISTWINVRLHLCDRSWKFKNCTPRYKADTYRRKDLTMSGIIETLRRIEHQVSSMNPLPHSNIFRSTRTPTASRSGPSGTHAFGNGDYGSLTIQRDLFHELQRTSAHLTVPHKVLLWPRAYSDLMASQIAATIDMPSILNEGMSWFVRREASKHPSALPAGNGLPAIAVNVSDRTSGHMPNIIFPTIAPEQLQKSTAGYFETFNLLYPILDRGHYMGEINEQILREGHKDGDARSVIMLLVLALGQVSTEGISGAPISIIEGQTSGFRGGSVDSPPGLAAFNEARRRFGFIATDCTLETVQALLLQSMYYESHARHLDYWRCVTSASLALQGLLKVQQIDWTSFHGDQVKRAFWACAVHENLFHIDLDLPGTELRKLEDVVPLPHFHEWQDGVQGAAPEISWIFHGQFLAMIALRAIIDRIHDVIYASEGTSFAIALASIPLTLD